MLQRTMTRNGVTIELPTPRDVVKAASEQVESSEPKSWLWNDEKGTWEHDAELLLEVVASRFETGKLDEVSQGQITTEGICKEAAVILAHWAVTAVLNVARRQEREKQEAKEQRRRK